MTTLNARLLQAQDTPVVETAQAPPDPEGPPLALNEAPPTAASYVGWLITAYLVPPAALIGVGLAGDSFGLTLTGVLTVWMMPSLTHLIASQYRLAKRTAIFCPLSMLAGAALGFGIGLIVAEATESRWDEEESPGLLALVYGTYAAALGTLVGALTWAAVDVIDALSSERAATRPAHVSGGPTFGLAPLPGGGSACLAVSF